jgi:hypothetical protein
VVLFDYVINIDNHLKGYTLMALVSPGVEVTVIDESQYLPASTNSVPYILLATAQNKASGTGTGVAAGTLAVNAGKVYLITSQRDLAATFGNPFFYQTSTGVPINGYELNEYGLLAAHSVLGISNRAYIQRADVDLSELTATLVRPTGSPNDGTYWLDTAQTSWGIFQWNQTTAAFTTTTPIAITDTTQLDGGIPSQDVGSIGDYAVVATNANNPTYYKNSANEWVLVGSDAWKDSWPTIQGTNSVTGNALTLSDVLIINSQSVAVTSPLTLANFVTQINNAAITGVTAVAESNKLTLYSTSEASEDPSTLGDGAIQIGDQSTAGLLTTLGITRGTYLAPGLQQSYSYQVPRWRTSDTGGGRPTGSVWAQMSPVNAGASIVTKEFSTAVGTFLTVECPLYLTPQAATFNLDPSGGGKNIAIGTLWGEVNSSPDFVDPYYLNTQTTKLYRYYASGQTVVAGDDTTPAFAIGNSFTIQATIPGSGSLLPATPTTVTLAGTTAADFVTAVSAAGITYVSAAVTATGSLSFIHSQGGVISLVDGSGSPLTSAGFTTDVLGVNAGQEDQLILSNYTTLTYTASDVAPDQNPADGRLWYYSSTDQVDIMVLDNGNWRGYRTVTNDVRGYNLSLTDPAGPIISATAPITQSDDTDLEYGDIWIDTSNLELYPMAYRWQNVSGVDQWTALDNTDQTTSNGVLFADARWAPNGTTDPIADNYPSITSLLASSYLDIDAPVANLYPEGILLWNTRRTGFNVKAFQVNYFNAADFYVQSYTPTGTYQINNRVLYNGVIYICIAASTGHVPTNTTYWSVLETNAWVSQNVTRPDGAPYTGRHAVRQVVVKALKSAVDTQDTLREEQQVFNLIACPQYPELMTNMVALNNERSNTAFVIGDTPLRLPATGTDIAAWASNQGGLGLGGEDGITTSDPYLGVFYPQCRTVDLGGNPVVQPSSHMMLRTIVRSDEVAFPWLAPAGTRRGIVDNAEAIGYINGQTGEFNTIATGQGLRDVLYTNKINPITFIPGIGITNYGNKTEAAVASALDRINVARLVAFIRGRLNEIGKTFVFEPNDQITRNEISNAINGLMIDLVAKRGIYDYLVVCDESNNTPARIDRNELYVDIAIEPVKAVEFIYIPVRIKNTGEISAGSAGTTA